MLIFAIALYKYTEDNNTYLLLTTEGYRSDDKWIGFNYIGAHVISINAHTLN